MSAFEACADLFTEAVDNVIDDAVVDEGSLLASSNDAGVEKYAKVLRDVLLPRSCSRDELSNACLAVHQLLDQPDSDGVAERAEALGD
jgi:hypothetical protein